MKQQLVPIAGWPGYRLSRSPDSAPTNGWKILFSRSCTGGPMQGGNLLTDNRIFWRLVDIDLRPVLILFGHAGISKDRFYRTLGHAGIAIDAGVGIYIKPIG